MLLYLIRRQNFNILDIPLASVTRQYLAYVEQILVPELRPGYVVIFDNLSAHTGPAVAQAIERAGARVLRLVTCGGEFNDEVNSYRSNVIVTAVPA